MIEFDVDMGYLLEDDELDAVILNDENGERESMRFVRERTCEKLPSYFEKSCIVTRGDLTMKFGYWRCSECDCENFEGARYCMACGAKVVER